jgi:hypothetical protein
MAHPPLSEEQQRQRELNARRDLEQLVGLLLEAASDKCRDPKLLGRDRALAFGRGAFLLATIDRLSKVLLDHPDVDVRADRLIDLHDAIEAAVILAGGLKAPVAHRLRTAAFRAAKAANDDRRKEIVVKVAESILREHPTWARSRLRTASSSVAQVNEQLSDPEKMTQSGIYECLKEPWPRLVSPYLHAKLDLDD